MKLSTRKFSLSVSGDCTPEGTTLSAEVYLGRIERLMELAENHGFSKLIVYGDREHFSNMEYLTGYDPRFEEALLVLAGGTPTIIVGNEGADYCQCIPFPVNALVYTGFSLNGQPRGSVSLSDILCQAGIRSNDRIGVIGWKLFSPMDGFDLERTLDIPSFIRDAIEQVAPSKNLFNKTDLLVSNEYGLRHNLEAEELVLFEQCNTAVSRKVLTAIRGLRPGDSEWAASKRFLLDGSPTCTHPCVSFGEKNASMGLASPQADSILARGDIVSIGMGLRRANVHRTFPYVSDGAELTGRYGEDAGEFLAAYFEALCAWYESLRIGTPGSEVYEAVAKVLHPLKSYGVKLNPGHQIHTDEWTNSMSYPGSTVSLRSGMALQCDIIASRPGSPLLGAHIEDGVFLADEALRARFAEIAPAASERVRKRREFMREVIGISLHDDVLPLSDLQGVGFPFGADMDTIFVRG